jgi:hypothetical protein
MDNSADSVTSATKTEGQDCIMAKKSSDAGLENLPACAAKFVQLIVKKMRYRKKVRVDVQAELAAHFEDQLKDCATDKEKEQKAQQLIAGFGEVKLLAVLLRRAKKRCRPLWKKVIVRSLQAVGIIIVLFCLYTAWFVTGKPTISVDYLAVLNQMSRPQVRDEDNAWPHYEKAVNLYIAPPRGGVVEEFISYRDKSGQLEKLVRFTDLSEDEQAQILEWIQQNQQHWDNLSAEQQKVILKCFQYNFVPFFKKPNLLYSSLPFESMTSYIIEVIKQKEQLTQPYHTVVGGLEYPGFPDAELKEWIKQDKIPPNYIGAVSVAVLNEWMKRYRDLPKSAKAPLTDAEYEYLSPWIRENEAAWQQLLAGSRKPYCYREYTYDPNNQDKWLFSIVMPHLSTLRTLARLGIWQSRIDRYQGQVQQALEDCLAVARFGAHWQGKGTFIEQLVGIAINALAHSEILYLTQAEKLSANQLKQLQQELSQIYPQGYPLIDMEGERLCFLDTVQHVFSDGGPGGGHLLPTRMMWLENVDSSPYGDAKMMIPAFTALGMVHARRDTTVAKANEIYDYQCKVVKMSPYERHIQHIDEDDVFTDLPRYKYFLIGYMMPATSRVSDIAYRAKVSHEATLTILALRRWQLDKGQYPAALDELVAAGYVKDLPQDPFSDKPLVYRRTDGDFILYTLGPNFTDDGGESGKDSNGRPTMWRDEGDTLFWPLPEPDAKR